MGHSKRHYITEAYAEIGKAEYAFDLDPEALQSALRRLDSMLAEWDGRGIRIGYAGGNGLGDIDADTLIPAWADEAIVLNLAVRLAPGFGKTVSPDTKTQAGISLRTVMSKTAQSRQRSLTGYGGAGNSGQALRPTDATITVGNDDELEF